MKSSNPHFWACVTSQSTVIGSGYSGVALEVGERGPVPPDLDDLPLLERDHGRRPVEHRGDVGREHRLAVAEADDQRRGHLHAHEHVGLVARAHDQRVGALELADRRTDGVGERRGAPASFSSIRWATHSVSVSETSV